MTKELPETRIEIDSYIAVQLLEQQKALDLPAFRKMAVELEGSFSLTVLDADENFYFVKGDSPLVLVRFSPGWFLYASTEEILLRALWRLGIQRKAESIPLVMGDLLRINRSGVLTWDTFPTDTLTACSKWLSCLPQSTPYLNEEEDERWFY